MQILSIHVLVSKCSLWRHALGWIKSLLIWIIFLVVADFWFIIESWSWSISSSAVVSFVPNAAVIVHLVSETMEQEQKGEASSGVYTYKHHYDKGFDIHEIFVKKCRTRVLLSYVGVIFLLANICQSLLAKEKLCLGSLWSITFGILVAKCLQYKPVKKESIVIMPTFGVQLEKHFWSGRIHRRFVPIGKILKPLLNECVTPVTCYWSLALLLRDEEELILVFQKFCPPVKMLVPIWKALCAITSSGCPRPSAVSKPNCSET